MSRFKCPVCKRDVKPTHGQTIARHLDNTRTETCRGGGEPFSIAIEDAEDPQSIHDVRTTLTFPERYSELRYDMALPIWQVAKQLNYTLSTLYRMLLRHNMTVPTELIGLVVDGRKSA